MNIPVETLSPEMQFSTLFHPAIDQHGQHYMYNRQHDLQALINQDKEQYLPLNHANLALGRFCKKLVLKTSTNTAASRVEDAMKLLQKWQDRFNQSGPFDTYPLADGIFSYLKDLDVDIQKELGNDPELQRAFINVPHHIKSFFQFQVLVPEARFTEWFSRNANLALQNKARFYYIREFTVYTKPRVIDESQTEPLTLVRIKMIPEIVQSRKNPVLSETLKWLQDSSIPLTGAIAHSLDTFAEQVGDNIFMSQGNTNYKKFLALTDTLGAVYSPENNHAYLK